MKTFKSASFMIYCCIILAAVFFLLTYHPLIGCLVIVAFCVVPAFLLP